MTDYAGKPTIRPWLFYSGKTCGYLTWLFFCLSLLHVGIELYFTSSVTGILTLIFAVSGISLIILSSVFLGNSIRIGLPGEQTVLKTGGIYRYSRNPMYVGAHLITLSGMVYTLNPWIILPGLYSFYVYHLIILGEERFLEDRFGDAYLKYKQKVNRYF